jgi:hypothetical protein
VLVEFRERAVGEYRHEACAQRVAVHCHEGELNRVREDLEDDSAPGRIELKVCKDVEPPVRNKVETLLILYGHERDDRPGSAAVHPVDMHVDVAELPIVEAVNEPKARLKCARKLLVVKCFVATVLAGKPVVNTGLNLLSFVLWIVGFGRGRREHKPVGL